MLKPYVYISVKSNMVLKSTCVFTFLMHLLENLKSHRWLTLYFYWTVLSYPCLTEVREPDYINIKLAGAVYRADSFRRRH